MCARKPKLSDKKQDLLERIIVLEHERDKLAGSLSEMWEIINNFKIAALMLEQENSWNICENLIKEFIIAIDATVK